MSDAYDVADDEDMAAFHGDPTLLSREACATCGGAFEAEVKDGGEPITRDCTACATLGARPCACLLAGCSGELHGFLQRTKRGSAVLETWVFECPACASAYSIGTIRDVMFGRACVIVVQEAERLRIDGTHPIASVVFATSRRFGVLRR